MPRGGKYKEQVSIEEIHGSASPDGAGELDLSDDDSWVSVTTERAAIQATGGAESFQGKQLEASITHIVQLRCAYDTAAITPKMRVVWDDRFGNRRILNIRRAYVLDPKYREVELQCEERV